MTLPRLRLRNIEKFTVDNSPVILTVIGAVGAVGTAVLTHKAATKTAHTLAEESPHMTRREVVEMTWKHYIPPVIVGAGTVAAIITANRIGSKRAAALATAFTIAERANTEYREKVVEKFGEQRERNMREELAQDQINRNPQTEKNVVVVGTGEVLCCDLFSGRYFRSSVEELKKAQNDTNHEILNYGYASLTDFYDRVGIPRTDVSDEVGWNQDKLLELEFSATINEEGQPCVAYRFQVHPVRGFFKLHP